MQVQCKASTFFVVASLTTLFLLFGVTKENKQLSLNIDQIFDNHQRMFSRLQRIQLCKCRCGILTHT